MAQLVAKAYLKMILPYSYAMSLCTLLVPSSQFTTTSNHHVM